MWRTLVGLTLLTLGLSAAPVLATCTTQMHAMGTRMVRCTTCCVGTVCNTHCV